jgi:transposase InsO family protein
MSQVRYGNDGTLARNNYKFWLYLIHEYNLVKLKQHTKFSFVQEFYNAHNIKRQNFIKYYNRYKQTQNPASLLPEKRGPRYKLKRTPLFVEQKVVSLRENGLSKHDIFAVLQPKLGKFTPSPSTIYNIAKRYGLGKLRPVHKSNRRKIIKTKPGELGHVDCHFLPRGLIANEESKRYYLVAVIDSYSRIAWAEVVSNIKALDVMFASLKIINFINARYNIRFDEMLSDNGSEFGSGPNAKNKEAHPFEQMLVHLDIKHRYTRPYRPQTNGKIERFWQTLKPDLIEDTSFDSLDHFKDELQQYLFYYNELRPHQSLNGSSPKNFLLSCHRIS